MCRHKPQLSNHGHIKNLCQQQSILRGSTQILAVEIKNELSISLLFFSPSLINSLLCKTVLMKVLIQNWKYLSRGSFSAILGFYLFSSFMSTSDIIVEVSTTQRRPRNLLISYTNAGVFFFSMNAENIQYCLNTAKSSKLKIIYKLVLQNKVFAYRKV